MPPVIDAEKCTGCGICDLHCPLDVLSMDPMEKVSCVKYPEECWHCGSCRQDCPAQAIDIVFPEDMIKIHKDKRQALADMFNCK